MHIKHLKNKLSLTAFCIVVVLLFWVWDIPCFYKHFLGVECIGCGMSRAYFALLKLDLLAAFNYHSMFWSVPIVYLYFLFDGKLFGKRILDYTVMILIHIIIHFSGFFIHI